MYFGIVKKNANFVGKFRMMKKLLTLSIVAIAITSMTSFISCGDDDVREQNVMQQYYAESLNLDFQTTDSIQRFASKLHSYVKHNPEAKSNPYYPKTTSQLHDVGISIKAAEWNEDVYVLIEDSYSSAPQM